MTELAITTTKTFRQSWLTSLRYRLSRTEMTRRLADGADPTSSDWLHRRASELTGEQSRFAIAAALERLLAGVISSTPYGIAPVNWRGVSKARARIRQLAARLRADPHARPQGVARAYMLLNDRSSDLFARDDGSRFADEVRSALALL